MSRTVVALHDATGERHPELLFPNARSRLFWRIKTKLALRRADRLVTVSEDARRQIAEVFDDPIDAITVVSEGPDAIYKPCRDAERAEALKKRLHLPTDVALILYVGGISPSQELERALPRACRRSRAVACRARWRLPKRQFLGMLRRARGAWTRAWTQ